MNPLLVVLLAFRFYLTPLIIGRGLSTIFHFLSQKIFKKKAHDSQSTERVQLFPVDFALGTLVTFVTALVIQYVVLRNYPHFSFQQLFFPFINGFTIAMGIVTLFDVPNWKVTNIFQKSLVTTTVLLTAALSYGLWLWNSPYQLNWDLYEHQTLVNQIQAGTFSYFTTQITDTFGFNSYPPVFHTLMAVSQNGVNLSGTDILLYWNVISFLHLLLVSTASYALGYVITKKREIAFLSCVIGTLTFDSVISFTNFFLLPQTLAAVLFVFLFCNLLQNREKNLKVPLIWLFICLLSLVWSHYIVGSLGAVLYLATFIYCRFQTFFDALLRRFLFVLFMIALMVGGVASSHFINLDFLNHGEAASYIFTLGEKFDYMRRIYAFEFLFLFPLGLFWSFRQKNGLARFFFLISLGFLAIILSQFPYVLKFYVIGRFFFHLLIAIGWWMLMSQIHTRVLRWLGYLSIGVFLVTVLVLNSLFWKQGLNDGQRFSHISEDEIAAAAFLKTQYSGQNVLMISDPATQYILEALSGVNSPGGAFASRETRHSLAEITPESSSSEVSASLAQIEDRLLKNPEKRVLIASQRFFHWQASTLEKKESFDYNIWGPQALNLKNRIFIRSLTQEGRFTPVYQNSSLVVLEMTQ